MGNTEVRALIHVARGPEQVLQRLRALARGTARVGIGGLRWVSGRLTGSVADEARGQRSFLRGAGMVLAAVGYKYFEYRRPPAPAAPGATTTVRVLESFRSPSSTTNPYIAQLYEALGRTPGVAVAAFSWRRAILDRWDVFHVHWPETTWVSADPVRRLAKQLMFCLLLVRIRVTRAAVVQTYHNVTSHEGRSRLESFLVRSLARLTTSYIVLNDRSAPPGGKPFTRVPHGHYVDWYAPLPPALPVPGRVATFGIIRPYKGVEELIAAFAALDDPTASLVVGGRPADAATAERLTSLGQGDPRVRLILRFLSESDLVTVVTQSQLMVFPYLEMHNSGAVLAALSLARPVLVPRNAVNEALAEEVGPAWVHMFGGRLTPELLASALAAAASLPPGTLPDLSRRDWATAGTAHREVFCSAVARRRAAKRARPFPRAG
jgi:glycosyltransferase involved in cell wall biosynthesis